MDDTNDPKPYHVVPENDLREHDTTDILCPCMPRQSEGSGEEPRFRVIVHNSYDRREVGEVMRKAIYLLGNALAGHGHKWTAEERDAFEHADDISRMHWPPLPTESCEPPRMS